MATISITVPDQVAPDVLDAIADRYNFTLNGGGRTKAQFAKAMLARHVKEIYATWKGEQARLTAISSAEAEADIT